MHDKTIDAITEAAGVGAPPRGFNAHRITEPPVVDHSADELVTVADSLTALRMESDRGGLDRDRLDRVLARGANTLRRLAGPVGALALVLGLVAAIALPTAPSAQAAEAPEPDPIAAVSISITLTSGTVRVAVPVAATSTTPRGYHCASVWGPTSYGRGFVGRACSRSARFLVPVTLDSRFVPVGRSTMAVTDDADPLGTSPQVVNLIARRPSRFGLGAWNSTQYGDGLTVYAPLFAYTPALGRWTPQQSSPVRVEELIGGRWTLRATLTTNRYGVALGTVILGGGPHTVRVRRLQGANVAPTAGTARTFILIPTDVPDGMV